jgi:hypothetical protein
MMRKPQPGIIVVGIGLFLLGGWLLALELGAPLVSFSRLWPFFLVVLGAAMLIQYGGEKRKRNGLLFIGVLTTLLGLFLSMFSLEIGRLTWPEMSRYWPFILLFIGSAFLLLYLAGDMQDPALLRPVYIFGGAGLVALPFTLGVLRGWVSSQGMHLWPLLIALIILAVFFQPQHPHEE